MGPRQAIAEVRGTVRRVIESVIDRILGVDTAPAVGYDRLEFGPDDGVAYSASSWLRLVYVYRHLRSLRPGPADAFLDYGCGKGRVLLLAARFPFGRLVGVERSRSLLSTAAMNMRHGRGSDLAGRVELVEVDAGDYVVPEDINTVYLFNPFPVPVVERVIDQLLRSHQRRPRALRLLYLNPVGDAVLRARGFRLARQLGEVRLYVLASSANASK